MKKLNRVLSFILSAAVLVSVSSCAAKKPAETGPVDPKTTVAAEEIKSDSARVYIDGTSFYVGGKEIWFNGANTPWDKWNDFGGSYNSSFWDEHFAKLHEAGVNASRIWINCNGIVGVRIDEEGNFESVTDKHWEDLDDLFALAEKHGVYIMATLMSFDHFKDENKGYQNWRNLIASSEKIDAFVEGYVVPFVKRYDNNDYLFSVDLMNEPDWVHENAECGKQSWDNICNLFAREAAAIHENSDVLVTVGMGMIKYNSGMYEGNKVSDEYLSGLSGNDNSYLDYYSPHFYHWEKQWFGYPFDKSPREFGLDGTRPAVIGECAGVDESKVSLSERYNGAYDNGWNGVFVWTSNGVDNCGGYDDMSPATTDILAKAEEKVYPMGR